MAGIDAAKPSGGSRTAVDRGRGPSRRLRSLLATLALAGTALLACGESTPRAEPKALRVLMTNDWADTAPFLAAVREFERSHADVRVDIEKAKISDMADTVAARIEAGNPPDVVQWHAYAAGARDVGQPLDDLWRARLHESDYLAGALEDVSWAGRRYGVPLDANAMVLVFNADHFTAAGLSPPRDAMTFQDLEREAQALARLNGGKAMALPSSNWWTYGWVRANGGEVVDVGADGKLRLTLNAPPVVEAVRFLAGLVQKGLAYPPRGAGTGDDVMALFRSGTTSVHATGSWDVSILQKDQAGARYGTAMMPRGLTGQTQGSALGGSSLFVPKGSAQRGLAFEFMVLLTSDRYALRFAQEEGRLPARRRVYENAYFRDPHLQTFLRQLESAYPPKLDAFPQAHAAFAQAVDDALHGRSDAGAALDQAQRHAAAALGVQ